MESGPAIQSLDIGWQEIEPEGEDAALLRTLWRVTDGKRDMRELAALIDWPLERIRSFVDDLYTLGIFVNAGDCAVPSALFGEHVINHGRSALQLLGGMDELGARLGAEPTPRLTAGWLLETLHFVLAAPFHLSPALGLAPCERTRMMMSEYLSSEYWHGAWLRDGLRHCFSDKDLEDAVPTPQTQALINFLRATSTSDFQGYMICVGILEGADSDELLADQNAWWDQLQAFDALPKAAIERFREHEILDIQEGHGSLSAEAFADSSMLSKERQEHLCRIALDCALAGDRKAGGIVEFYGRGNEIGVYRFDWAVPTKS